MTYLPMDAILTNADRAMDSEWSRFESVTRVVRRSWTNADMRSSRTRRLIAAAADRLTRDEQRAYRSGDWLCG